MKRKGCIGKRYCNSLRAAGYACALCDYCDAIEKALRVWTAVLNDDVRKRSAN